ncbi:hypothetical protein SDC9_165960 [bioreactor metagenome]|uniref:Uncharacterized protein n=1 Tax=bioreactor metagenome TaxID=1076179 RepID=A0A645FY88_9ZZZZ
MDAKAALLLLRGQSGGHRHPAAPNASPSAGAALPAPQGAETTAADDWLTTQQEPDKPQAESLSEGEAAQNAGENSKKRFESSWIWAFVGGALCLGGAAWMLILRPKHRGS